MKKIALLLVGCLIFSIISPTFTFADNTIEDIDGVICANGEDDIRIVTGDVASVESKNGATVTIQGDVIAPVTEEQAGSNPIVAVSSWDDASVIVEGNVSSAERGVAVEAFKGGNVTVAGEVNGGSVFVSWEDSQVNAGGGTIAGASIHGKNASLSGIDIINGTLSVDDHGTALINGNVNGPVGTDQSTTDSNGEEITIHRPTTLSANDHANVIIGGDITTGEKDIALVAIGNSDVTVNGHVTAGTIEVIDGGNVTIGGGTPSTLYISGNSSNLSVNGDLTTTNEVKGIEISDGGSVTVTGNLTNEETATVAVYHENSALDVVGEINGGQIAVTGKNAHITAGGGTVSKVTVAGGQSTLMGIENIEATGPNPALDVSGNTHVEISGNVKGGEGVSGEAGGLGQETRPTYYPSTAVSIQGNSKVEIGGDVTVGEGLPEVIMDLKDGSTYYLPRSNTAVRINDKSTLSVGGDITTSEFDYAIDATNGSSIEVSGNITGGTVRLNGENTIVTVAGETNLSMIDIVGKDASFTSGDGTITQAQVTGQNASLSDIDSIDNSEKDYSLIVTQGASAEIKGDVSGGEGYHKTYTDISGNERTDFVSGRTVIADGNATVDIGGNLNGNAFISNASDLNVNGDVSSELHVSDGSKATVGGDLNDLTSVVGPKSELTIGGNVTYDRELPFYSDVKDTAIIALDGATVIITGNVNTNARKAIAAREDETTVTVKGDVVGRVDVSRNAEVNIEGDLAGKATLTTGKLDVNGSILGDGIIAIEAFGPETEITVGEDVTGVVSTSSGVKTTINGDVNGSVRASVSQTTVGGKINSKDTAVYSSNAEVLVNNNITSEQTGVEAEYNGTAKVNGSVTAGQTGISTLDGSSVDIQGNVTAGTIGIEVTIGSSEDAQSNIVVNGTVNGSEKAIELTVATSTDTDTVISALPQIIVQSLETEGDMVVVTSPSESVDQSAVTDALISQIHYIVNQEGIDSANISVFGTEKKSANGNDYVVAKETSKITLKSTNDGYVVCSVSAGKYATIEENGDGSYTITVERGGDLNLVASVKEKPAENDNSGNNQGDDGNTIGDNGNGQNQGENTSDDGGSGQSQGGSTSDDSGNGQNQGDNGNSDSPSVPGNPAKLDWPHDNGNHLGWPDNSHNTRQNTSNNQNNNGRSQNAYSDYLLMPDYSSMILTINLVDRNKSTVLRTDLEVFQKAGFATVNIVTEDASLFMAMANLLELYGGSSRCTFVRNGNTVELWVRDALVVTVTLIKKDPIAA